MIVSPPNVLDLFAGPGGWDEGMKNLPVGRVVGIEKHPWAARTAELNGHLRLVEDVTTCDSWVAGAFDGMVASPPCRTFSGAGGGKGRHDFELLRKYAPRMMTDERERFLLAAQLQDKESALILEPLRFAVAGNPDWMAWEQVPEALDIWKLCAELLEGIGYRTWVGILKAEWYGVAQSRSRAILMASNIRQPVPPKQFFSGYNAWNPGVIEPGMPSWRRMADVLDFEIDEDVYLQSNYNTSGKSGKAGLRHVSQPAFTLTGRMNRMKWVSPGLGESESLSIQDGAVLQSFPREYRWYGTKLEIAQQIGDAVPPLMAEAIVGALL